MKINWIIKMELMNIKSEDDKIKVYIRHSKMNIPKEHEFSPEVYGVNEEVFNSKDDVKQYYLSLFNKNNDIIKDYEQRLSQMPLDALDKVNDFAIEIKDLMFEEDGQIKKKLQHNKRLKNINELIITYKNAENMKYSIKKLKEYNDEIDKIISELNKL